MLVRNELAKLLPEKQAEFLDEYNRKVKSNGIGYVLWFFGLHYAYFQRWGMLPIFLLTAGKGGAYVAGFKNNIIQIEKGLAPLVHFLSNCSP